MNTQQLEKGRFLNEEIEDKRSLLRRLKGEGHGQIAFSKSNSTMNDGVIFTYGKKNILDLI